MTSQLRGAGILGTGSYTPPKVLTNFDIEKLVDTSDEWIVTRSGISKRHIAEEGVAASDLAFEAATKALEMASITPDQLDLIICATFTADQPLPTAACMLQNKLQATHAAAFDMQAGCSGWVYALTTATQYVRSGASRYVLVVGVDVLSRVTDWTDRSSCFLFGDGAGAVVVGPTDTEHGVLSTYLGADGSGADLLKINAGGSRLPASEETVRNRDHYLKMEGREVFKFSVRIMGEACLKALQQCSLTTENVDVLIPHQANLRIIDSASERLGISSDKVFVNIHEYGNTSAASIPIALDEAYRSGRIKADDIAMLVGFGGGLTWASAVVKWILPKLEA